MAGAPAALASAEADQQRSYFHRELGLDFQEMLRRGKFNKTETALAGLIGFLVLMAGAIGFVLALRAQEWKFCWIAGGAITLALVYLIAAIRRRPF